MIICASFKKDVRFEVFTAVTMKNVVFWDLALCRSCVNLRFGGTYRLHFQGRKIRERGTRVSRWNNILIITLIASRNNERIIRDNLFLM
jgi:hypothetical protein